MSAPFAFAQRVARNSERSFGLILAVHCSASFGEGFRGDTATIALVSRTSAKRCRMCLRSSVERPAQLMAIGSGRDTLAAWFGEALAPPSDIVSHRPAGRLLEREAARIRHLIEGAVSEVFGIAPSELAGQSRGKAPVAHARQAAMYLAHVTCRLSLTDVGQIFARDRTTVSYACAAIEDRRDDPQFDRILELMEWIIPTLVGARSLDRYPPT